MCRTRDVAKRQDDFFNSLLPFHVTRDGRVVAFDREQQ
jgi:hypothetical protein